jgi:hypothetical protein
LLPRCKRGILNAFIIDRAAPGRRPDNSGGNAMNGMFVMGFGAHTDSDIAQSFSFHHEFEPTSMICELSLSMVDENNDNSGSGLWFSSFTFEDNDGTPHDVAIDFGAAVAHIGHDRLRRCEWNMRLWNVHARGLFNAFFWDSVS